ncbi:hypothetical protein RRG53_00860 [Mycoplasmopsis cynos]|uniref:Putative P60-like lipoprotein n=1 Tax=Mycoplasmopsis cynos (strain C142) TaxID=1246955 RepID=L0RVD5_MYCC1|nr:hypothetical protein [Mycoplasmopsis cynos]MCU9932667.1 hypothetical protein [Mycoplasmopsis cynos]WQQ18610.1 hypothetical protein RRG53_00860 [Mycoplasmopsis cynos]CCP24599.1 Putative P60-like lipoprotein [Mycoplasmopsis cynos C142]
MRIFKKFLAFAPILVFPTVAIACGREVNSNEKITQDQLFSSTNVKNVVESLWLDNTLKNLYSIGKSDDIIKNKKFQDDAFGAYKTFVQIELQKDSKYLAKEISKLLSEGLISDAQFKELESITLTVNPDIKLNQFLTLYNLKESGVKLSVNKLLLIYKYFTLSKEDDIKKVYNSAFQSRKDDYVLQNFILIDYLVNKKIAQVWKYESTNDNDIFTLSVKTISNIDDYNKITQKIFDVKKIATKDVLFSKNEFEATLGGYKGIETTSLSFDYSLNALKENTSDTILSGFYDFNNNKLVKVNSDKTLAQAISVAPEGNKINITYLNRLVPIGKSFQIDNPNTKEKTKNPKITVKKLTLENTYFSSNLLKLIVALSQNDNNLYTLATEAFVNLGNKITLKVDDPNLKKALEGLKYVG